MLPSASGPPGNRIPSPMTATGSSSAAGRSPPASGVAGSTSPPVRNLASASTVGYCQKSTGDTVRPTNSDNTPVRTTASRDPTPRSCIEAPASICSGLQPLFVTR